MSRLSLPIACVLVCAAAGCSKKEPSRPSSQNDARRTVFTVNYPLAFFAERLAPQRVKVVFPAPADVDPAFWKPSPEEIGRYQAADVILRNGAGYAKWTRIATLPNDRIVATADGCVGAFLPSGESGTHQHGPEGAHAHAGTAFTTWLDLRLARCQAEHVKEALLRLAPADESSVEARFTTLADALTELDTRLRSAGKALGGRPLAASHPVYQYLENAYGLNVQSLHWEPDQSLDADAIEELDALLERHPATRMLWEAPPSGQTKRFLAERNVEVVVFEPAANRPKSGDFLSVMRANVARLACAAGSEPCP